MNHHLKINSEYFEAVLSGKKKFEIRYNDRNFKIGDSIILREITKDRKYTGRKINGTITYITDFEQKEGFVVFSFDTLN